MGILARVATAGPRPEVTAGRRPLREVHSGMADLTTEVHRLTGASPVFDDA